MPSDDELEVAGLRLRINDGWDGPQLDVTGATAALAWCVNAWAHGEFHELLTSVEGGKDVFWRGFGAGHAYPEDLTDERISAWRQLSGTDIGSDPVVIGSPMSATGFLLPRRSLIEILHAVADMRRKAATRSRQSSVVPADAAPVTPRLFTRTPSDQPPSEQERVALGDVEDHAVALDALAEGAATDDARALVRARRRALLDQLEASGLLDEVRVHEKRAFLEGFRLPALRDYVDAAIALRAYLGGAARVAAGLGAPPSRLLDVQVSLDWFRRPTPPPTGVAADPWLAAAERLVRERSPDGDEGELLDGKDGRNVRVLWRRDHGTPAVVAACEVTEETPA